MLLPLADVITAYRVSNFAGQRIVEVLLLGSVFTWSIMVTKCVDLIRACRATDRFLDEYRRDQPPFGLLARRNQFIRTPLLAVYLGIVKALTDLLEIKPADLLGAGAGNEPEAGRRLNARKLAALQRVPEQLIAGQMLKLEHSMGWLATTVTAAPFLGLLGTVWGVMDAFGGLALTRVATLAAVAPGVSGALLTTVVGLLVALPSSIGYNYLVARIRRLTADMERFSQDLLHDIEKRYADDD
jgi:biopolymer transport protein TolQ